VCNRGIRARIVVARKAQLTARLEQQRRLVGGVRIVAVEARSILERLMRHPPRRQVRGVVTVAAELAILCGRGEGIRVAGGVVAGFAIRLGHGGVALALRSAGCSEL